MQYTKNFWFHWRIIAVRVHTSSNYRRMEQEREGEILTLTYVNLYDHNRQSDKIDNHQKGSKIIIIIMITIKYKDGIRIHNYLDS